MIKIEYIHTKETYSPELRNFEKEDIVVKPAQAFNSLDEAWDYAMAHGCNPNKNFRVYSI